MTREEFANLLLPECKHDREYYLNMYPKRELPEGAMVTRIGPSPTGFVHIGTLYQAIVATGLARQSGGVSFVRIEDTDNKREVENGKEAIIKAVRDYDMDFTEGADFGGNYGPYVQSERKDIYQAFVKNLIIRDLAYPSFITEEELAKISEEQKMLKERQGYFGKWANKERSMSMEEAIKKVNAGTPYTIRLKSMGDFDNKIVVDDLIKGKVEFPENDMDIVLLKKDGMPTYHLAHAIDDTLMGTTVVSRGDEWLSSVPVHVELFKALGFPCVKYAHLATIQKEEDGKRRKISKRKDPEANVEYYTKEGIPKEAVRIYLLTLANSNFEEWFRENPNTPIEEFKIDFKKMATSGALFDMEKLLNISRNYLASIKATDVYERTLTWAKVYDKDFATILENNKEMITNFLNIERESNKPRKDFGKYSEVKEALSYMYELPTNYEWANITDKEEIKNILNTYINNYYNESDDNETWFNKLKEMCDNLGYASNMKEYKQNPDAFKGNVADVSTVIRVALTGRTKTPNLTDIMHILGLEEIKRRIAMI